MAVNIDGDGLIALGGTSTTQGRVRLAEDSDNGTNFIELTAPASVGSDRVITFPDVTGTVLTTASAGTVLQVVSTTKTDTFTTGSTSYVDLTGLSVSITPTSATSKIFVSVMTNVSNDNGTHNGMIQLVRNSTAIAIGDAVGSRAQASAQGRIGDNNAAVNFGVQFLDSPATTSATTYKIQIKTQSGTACVNRTSADTDVIVIARTVSTITVMEIAG